MAYSTNPSLPRVRREAVRLVTEGWSTRKVARHLGYTQSAVVKWCARAPGNRRLRLIPTRSSRPHHHPRALPFEVVDHVLALSEQLDEIGRMLGGWRKGLEKTPAR